MSDDQTSVRAIVDAFDKFWCQVQIGEYRDHTDHELVRNRDLKQLKAAVDAAAGRSSGTKAASE